MKNSKLRMLTALVITIMFTTSFSFSHSGRTDSSGGHRDNKNKSGLGPYHYHCGGYPPHLHENGCPYKGGGSLSQSQESSEEKLKKQANKNGYSKGYECGYNDQYKDTSSYTGSFTTEYEEGYESGYNDGVEKLKKESDAAKKQGYEIGISGGESNNTYTNEYIKSSYDEGYSNGYEEYKNKKIVEYTTRGKEDGLQDKDKADLNDTNEAFKDAYNKAYEDSQKIIKDKFKKLGFKEAIKGNKYIAPKLDKEKYIEWFKSGYDEGKIKLSDEIDKAYELGYKGKELVIPDYMKNATKSLKESYSKGIYDKDKNTKNTALAISGVGAIGAVGGTIYYKNRNRY